MQPDSFADGRAGWLKRHVEAKGLRTGDELKRMIENYVLPRWRDRAFADIRRSDVAALLDAVEDEHGHWMADSVLSVLRSVSSLVRHAATTITSPPFVKNMRRTPAAGAQAQPHAERRRAAQGLASSRGRRRRVWCFRAACRC